MRYLSVFALAAGSTAFVVPNEQIFRELATKKDSWYDEALSVKDSVLSSFKQHFDEVTESSKKTLSDAADTFDDNFHNALDTGYSKAHNAAETATNALDVAFSKAQDAAENVKDRISETTLDAQSWFETETADFDHLFNEPHHDRPHRRPHKPHHGHCKPNQTVYELINNSKYTTKLAFLINQYPDLVKALNGTKANYTIFAPTDRAFEKIPDHAHKPSKEQIEKLLSYHVSPEFYPAGRVLVTHTVPTLLTSDSLGEEPLPQRLRLHLGLNGLTVNFYSRIVAVDIFGTNGVIHGVDSLILPPPRVVKIIDLLPGEFSTLELALGKTGLLEKLNSTDHAGGTFFAPSNDAFRRLGPRINAFLFSEHGLKYLKALLEYHVVPKNTLYSDAFYSASSEASIPKGRYHVELPTLLKDRSLSIDIARFGGFITMKINGFNRVAVQDGIAKDGVIHALSSVLFPPRHVDAEFEEEEELEVEDLMARLSPFVSKHDL